MMNYVIIFLLSFIGRGSSSLFCNYYGIVRGSERGYPGKETEGGISERRERIVDGVSKSESFTVLYELSLCLSTTRSKSESLVVYLSNSSSDLFPGFD